MLVRTTAEPRPDSGDLSIVFGAKSADVNFFQMLSSNFSLGFGLPERGEHCVHIVVQIAFHQAFPLVAIEPDAFAAAALIQRESKTVPDQILDHAKAALGAIDMLSGLSQSQAAILISAL